MLVHLRTVPLRASSRPWIAVAHSRAFTGSFISRREQVEEIVDDDATADDLPEVASRPVGNPMFQRWLADEGRKFKTTARPRNWIGGEVPFPLNPTFKPPTPLSDQLRTKIYDEYMSNPDVYDVRKLSERYGISLKRVDAILRLKGLEAHWKQKKPLQTGFLVGMEEILGVTADTKIRLDLNRGTAELGENASEADQSAEGKTNNKARERYQRFFWEPVVEGQEPVVHASLERQRVEGAKLAKKEMEAKFTSAGLPNLTKVHDEHVAGAPGRPSIRFVNVGAKFVDVDDRMRRMKEGQRRSKLREKRKLRSHSGQERSKLVQ